MLRLRSLSGVLLACALLGGCRFGMDYSGDERGIARAAIRVEDPTGAELSYLIHGDASKPRVIFIHGSPGSSSMYVDYLRELEDQAEVIAVDRLGYGASSADVERSLFIKKNLHVAPAGVPLRFASEGREAAQALLTELRELYPGFSPANPIIEVMLDPVDDVFRTAPDEYPESVEAVFAALDS